MAELIYRRAEMVLAKDPVWQLREPELSPDPLAPLVSVIANTDPDEQVEVVMDLVPVLPSTQQRWVTQKRQQRDGASAGGKTAQLWREMTRGTDWQPDPAEEQTKTPAGGLVRKALSRDEQVIHKTLSAHQAWFDIQLLIRAGSPVEGRATELLHQAITSLEAHGGDNYWRVRSRRVAGLYWGADMPWQRTRFDRRFDGGRIRQRRTNRLSATSLMGFLKPPTSSCGGAVLRSGGILPPPPADLPRWRRGAGLMPLGEVTGRRGRTFVGAVPLEDSLFSLTTGSAQYGKTESALSRILATVDAGHGVMFIDPHADAISRLKPYLTRQRRRVLEISLQPGRQTQAAWNPFSISHIDQLEERMTSITDSVASAVGWKTGRTDRALAITSNTVKTLLELSLLLPPSEKPTIFQIPKLLSDEDWRNELVSHLPAPTRDYWSRFAYKDTDFAPLTNLVDRLRAARSVAALLGSSRSEINIRREMDAGSVILVPLHGAGTFDQLVASLLVYQVLEALRSRSDLGDDESARRPFHLFVDEAQTVDSAIGALVSALVEQTRKFGGRLHGLTQSPERLTEGTRTALMTNRSHLITTSVSHDGAKILKREWASQTVDPDTIQNLPKYQFIGQVRFKGERSDPFRIGGLPLDELWGEEYRPDELDALEERIERIMRVRPIEDTIGTGYDSGSLDTLNDRILEMLRSHNSTPPPERPTPLRPVPDDGSEPVYSPDTVRRWRSE